MISGLHTLKGIFQKGAFPKWNILYIALFCFATIALTSFKADETALSNMEILESEDCDLQLTIVNEGNCHLEVYEWLTDGDVYKFDLEAGQSQTVTTHDGAMWRVTNGDWNNLIYDESITINGCSNRTWTAFPTYCDAPMNGWTSACGSGERVEIVGKGINNQIPATLNFANSSNIYKAVVEVVYKGNNPGATITLYDAAGNPFSANREQPTGSSSNVWVYRAMLPSTSSVTYYESLEEAHAQSMVAYLFRNDASSSEQTGVFTYVSGYNDFRSMNFNIPASTVARDVTVKVPMSELTEDGRYLLLRAKAGGVSNQKIVYGPSSTLGCCLDIIELTLSNVPAFTNVVTLEIDTRHLQNGQTVNGQSYVLAGAVEVDGSCDDPCGSTPCDITCDFNDHGLSDSGTGDRLVWLKFTSLSDEVREYSVVNGSSKLEEFSNGTALLTGTVQQINNSTNRWTYHVKLINKRNWSQWSALGRSYKDANNTGNHPSWNFYEVDNSNSYFTGVGGHAGESLDIQHKPVNKEFGFQVGNGANDKNGSYGMSGWFWFSGTYSGGGDFNGNLENCGGGDPCASLGGDSDNDGVCDNNDCQPNNPNVPATVGSSCNDNNPCTINDVYVTDCNCEGTVKEPKLTIVNNGNCPIELYHWISGGDVFTANINAGDNFIVDTYDGAMWRVKYGTDWNNLLFDESYTVSGCNDQTWTVTANYCVPSNCSITSPGSVNLTCSDDTSPNFTGYPTIACDNGGTCQRDAGYHELDYQIFSGSTTNDWSFGQGWEIGSGCTPSCGLAPNAFIDFTNMYYDYDRRLTSPVFDACCMDYVQIDYCIRSDLYTNAGAPTQYMDVQYKIGNGNWQTLKTYQSVNGQTNDFNEDDLVIPGAAGNTLRVRFRVRGPGGSFTLGGWGVDR